MTVQRLDELSVAAPVVLHQLRDGPSVLSPGQIDIRQIRIDGGTHGIRSSRLLDMPGGLSITAQADKQLCITLVRHRVAGAE